MKNLYRKIAIGLWVILSTLILARWWLVNPESFPGLPESLWKWLSEFTHATCCEANADLEAIVSIGLSFIIISVLTAFVLMLWTRYRRNSLTKR